MDILMNHNIAYPCYVLIKEEENTLIANSDGVGKVALHHPDSFLKKGMKVYFNNLKKSCVVINGESFFVLKQEDIYLYEEAGHE